MAEKKYYHAKIEHYRKISRESRCRRYHKDPEKFKNITLMWYKDNRMKWNLYQKLWRRRERLLKILSRFHIEIGIKIEMEQLRIISEPLKNHQLNEIVKCLIENCFEINETNCIVGKCLEKRINAKF